MLCVPIVARTTAAAVAQMEQAAVLADVLELRIDQIKDVDLGQLLAGKRNGKRILVTNRRADEGGGFMGTERERVALLQDAVVLGADYVDIEAGTERTLLRGLVAEIEKHRPRVQWVISDHDFRGTPSERVLRKKFDRYRAMGADIVKIVTLAQTMEDNLRVLGLIPYALHKGQAIIALCMGEKGRISRVMAPLVGSFMGYAAADKGAESAAGQLTVAEMRQIYQILSPS